MTFAIDDVHPFHQLLISIGLGLLVGLQREWAESRLGGVRTFSLVSILGTGSMLLAEKLGSWIFVAAFLATTLAMGAGAVMSRLQLRDKSKPPGLSTEIAILLMFLIGGLVRTGPLWVALAFAGALAVIMQSKLELHGLASRFSQKDLKALMQLVLISMVILPVVPNQPMGPLQVINPRDVWLMVILITGLGFSGYVAYKFYGDRAGILLSGVLGGVISSTATSASYARRSKGESLPHRHVATIILLAWTTVYARILIEIAIAAPGFRQSWIPIIVLFVVSALGACWLWRDAQKSPMKINFHENPSELKTALLFAAAYSMIILAIAYAKDRLGSGGLMAVAVLSGITDMDAVTLSTARLVHTQRLSGQDGWPLIIAAATSNLCFKGILVGALGSREVFRSILGPWIASLCVGLALITYWLFS